MKQSFVGRYLRHTRHGGSVLLAGKQDGQGTVLVFGAQLVGSKRRSTSTPGAV